MNEAKKISVDDFRKIKVIGKGGFGKVLLVKENSTGKLLAMKVMEKAKIIEKPRDFKNLMSEKRILQNDFIFLVHLHYAFQTDTDFYLIMDFLGGGDLNFHLKRQERFSEKVVQFLIAELVLALDYLHSCGIIYRDLKPQNILLDRDGHVCLADFGLSKEVTASIEPHTACGTPSYSAPEVLEGNPYGRGVDWWGLGIVMYQLLFGKTPFEFNGDFRALLQSITSGVIRYPLDMSDNARSLIGGVLEKDSNNRLYDTDIMKRHPFFKGIDWEKLEVKKCVSPFKLPKVTDPTAYCEPKYTNLPVHDLNEKKKPKEKIRDFSYNRFD